MKKQNKRKLLEQIEAELSGSELIPFELPELIPVESPEKIEGDFNFLPVPDTEEK